MSRREEIVREQRTIEAMKKGYMGLEGKFAYIVKHLGESMFSHTSPNFTQTYLPDPLAEEEEIPIMDEDAPSYEYGQMFDGLTRGLNLNIQVINYLREIKVRYEGRIVYREVGGELEGYVPDEGWEQRIEELCAICKKVEKNRRPELRRTLLVQADRKRKQIFDELRLKWGL